jgi:tetratricopeptide (TPR) repeat protein
MPGHIYMRVGRYSDAVKVNQKAVLADEHYISQCFAQGLYPLGYYPHNIHFLWSAASMLGNSELAIDAAKKTAEKVPASILKGSIYHQNYAITPLLAYTRFGKWNQILTTPNPGEDLTYMKLIWNYTRGVAFVRKNNLKDAEEELLELSERNTSLKQENIAKVAFEVLAGEIEAKKGNLSKAIAHMERAVLFEDELPYDEPSAWHIPTRQSLGFILLKAKKYEAAEKAYKEDLSYYRQNGWSLIGLYTSLIGQNKIEEAKKIKKKFDLSWSEADIEINSSIL